MTPGDDVMNRYMALPTIRKAQIDWLRSKGVSTSAIANPDALVTGEVAFTGSRFDFHDEADGAAAFEQVVVVLVRDTDGCPLDLGRGHRALTTLALGLDASHLQAMPSGRAFTMKERSPSIRTSLHGWPRIGMASPFWTTPGHGASCPTSADHFWRLAASTTPAPFHRSSLLPSRAF